MKGSTLCAGAAGALLPELVDSGVVVSWWLVATRARASSVVVW
jgi:hypothetical protein